MSTQNVKIEQAWTDTLAIIHAAKMLGYHGRIGGWIYRPDGKRTTAHGWDAFCRTVRSHKHTIRGHWATEVYLTWKGER